MQTKLPKPLRESAIGKKADEILRSCVHCGFCLATCPTYQLLGNELDSPRGRIYLIKSALEDNQFSVDTLGHLDSCLTCRSCETTCPSGVKYSELLEIGRELAEHSRPVWQRMARYSVRQLLSRPRLFSVTGRVFRHSSPQTPTQQQNGHKGHILLLTGCVQPTLTPTTNHATKNVLAKLGYAVTETPAQACCGAVNHHTSAPAAAHVQIKRNIDDWCGQLDAGIAVIISTASGCGVMVKDYPTLFQPTDPYYEPAVRVANHTQDIAEFLSDQDLSSLTTEKTTLSYHAPCTLQHGQKLANLVEGLLTKLGYELSPVKDSHLCCGSAGTYSIFQPAISKQLRNNKLGNLLQSQPDVIVTANIGCQMHLAKGSNIPVKHWIELLDIA